MKNINKCYNCTINVRNRFIPILLLSVTICQKRMNECLVNNIIPDLVHISSLNLLVMSFELVIPISNKNKMKILKNNIKGIYLNNSLND
jgi:hypothetical protein